MRADITESDALYRNNINNTEAYIVEDLKFIQPYDEKLIRFGSNHDGGYLIPEMLLTTNTKLLSFGIGHDYTFEQDWFYKISNNIVSYDYQEFDTKETIYDIGARFINSKITTHNIDELIEQECNVPFYIKMDIEGEEYNILEKLIDHKNCLGVVLEFHGIEMDNIRRISDNDLIEGTIPKQEYLFFKKLVEKIKLDYNIVHVHCNNGPYRFYMIEYIHFNNEIPTNVIEITFLRKRLCTATTKRKVSLLPGLDYPNCGEPEINLIFE